jgi:TRAP-type uncharacterized transport system substrate-binding protein
MKLKHALLGVAVALAFTAPAMASDELVISTGGLQGTYHAFFVDIKKRCGDVAELKELESKGSDKNLENLTGKDADLAFVQTDTLKFQGMKNPDVNEADIQTLLPLYREEVHLVAKGAAKTSGGVNIGGMNFGGKTVVVKNIEDLAGMRVGAWGGSLTTAQAINVFGNVGMVIVPYTAEKGNDAAAKADLDAGKIDVILAVGGQPLGFAKGLNASYRLLEIGSNSGSKMSFYVPAKLNYSNMNASGISTIAAQTYLVTRNFRSAGKKAAISKLKQCIVENLDEFVEGKGYHPKWKEVKADTPTVWAKYETTTTKPAAPAKKK